MLIFLTRGQKQALYVDTHKVARFQRTPLNKVQNVKGSNETPKFYVGIPSYSKGFSASQTSYVGAVKNKTVYKQVVEENSKPSLVLDDSCIHQYDYSVALIGKVTDFGLLTNLKMVLIKEGFDNLNLKYLGCFWVLIELCTKEVLEKFKSHVGVGSWFASLEYASDSFVIDERVVWVDIEGEEWQGQSEDESDVDAVPEMNFSQSHEASKQDNDTRIEEGEIQSDDPFNIDALLQKKTCNIRKEEEKSSATLKYPPGFTTTMDRLDNKGVPQSKEYGNESRSSGYFRRTEGPRTGGSILQILDDVIKVGQTMGFKMDGCVSNIEDIIKRTGENEVNFLSLQETKLETADNFCIKNCWGNLSFEFVCGPSVGNSGGIICVWDPSLFCKHNSTISDYFVAIQGEWIPNVKKYLIISVYAPKEFSEKRMLWSYLNHMIDNWSGESILMGDFNEVRSKEERFGSIFNNHNAIAFNSFISSGGLMEVPLGGCAFTWCHKSGNKMSKLDRFLISESLMGSCPNMTSITLDRYLSDHRPILLREVCYDYGPTPFRMFHYWFEWEGFDKFIVDTWSTTYITDNNAISKFMKKMRYLKGQIRMWVKDKKESACMKKSNLKGMLNEINLLIDEKKVDQELLNKRMHVLNSLQDLERLEAIEIAQKAIRGILKEWIWVEDPNSVKNEFLSHFKERFDSPCSSRLLLDMIFPNRINAEQNLVLKRHVSNEEIKRAVWDCGTDKSPGPDGFTFGFYRRYWDTIEIEVVEAISYFFIEGTFPKGGNASFIALIPKMQDAKLVKDYRPISLIGSLYKIIAKILANHLVGVLGDLVNEVQSAFITNRQILDGPFILDELIQWCKSKRKQTMIFKVDFEKAYDSVRWDYLDDVLKKFGFGSKWRHWIHNCLQSSKGSILVNGSPTGEFQFRKGLKQGDPLSPFLFLLIMESLHLSFQNVVNEGLFKGVSVSSSLQLSHLFYADDVIFMGQWSESNIHTIVLALDCFYKASGLRLNLHKSKLIGIAVEDELVSRAALKMGCSTLKSPFSYLGITVGGSMSRIKAWDDIVEKLQARLSKWKMNTLSTGGRLTLIKSVLGSTPIYYMSMYKVPSQVLKYLEGGRRNFFIGADPKKEKKMSWFKWSRVLASKEKGGLGVSSLFALNRALLFKWMWRFHNDKNALWSRFIHALHGNSGGINKRSKVSYSSNWMSIVTEVSKLKNNNIDLLGFMKKRVGNGLDTSFWEDVWRGEKSFKLSFPKVYALETDKKISVASKMKHNEIGSSFRRLPRNGVELEQYSSLAAILEGVLLPDMIDRWVWSLAGSGEFSVASTRKFIDDHRLLGVNQKTRWLKEVPKKINILAWKVRFDLLPTRLNLSRRGVEIQSIVCPTCNKEVESSSHIFFVCSLARDIYRKIASWWELTYSVFYTYEDWFE
ncbi:RNA-directed DNA polymerase, eukaryota, partial [Tanacetum coccineum]